MLSNYGSSVSDFFAYMMCSTLKSQVTSQMNNTVLDGLHAEI